MSGLDIVGIGALNVDFFVRDAEVDAEWGTEVSVDAATVGALVPGATGSALGGSAFNAVSAIAHARPGLGLGFVGVAGRVPAGGLSAVGEFDAFGVDRRFVFVDDERWCGVCVSVMRDGERTLLTHAGANVTFSDHLDRHFDALVGYLGRARLVHVTSFLDDRSAGRLATLLESLKKAHPRTLVCFDPGHVWSAGQSADVARIVRRADFVVVNRREFEELAPRGTGAVVVVKQPDGTRWYDRRGAEHFLGQVPLAAGDIVDATGAGDAFAAGLLIALAGDGNAVAAGCARGLRMARDSLQ